MLLDVCLSIFPGITSVIYPEVFLEISFKVLAGIPQEILAWIFSDILDYVSYRDFLRDFLRYNFMNSSDFSRDPFRDFRVSSSSYSRDTSRNFFKLFLRGFFQRLLEGLL